ARGEVGRHADDDTGLAVPGDADDSDDAASQLLLAVIGKTLEILHLDAFDRARHQLDVADLAHAGRSAVTGSRAAAHGELLARIGQLALELLALVHQCRD